MPFRDSAQRAAVCNRIARNARRGALFSADGPTPVGMKWAPVGVNPASMIGSLSSTERQLVKLAWDAWNGSGKVMIGAMLDNFDTGNTRLLAAFFSAWAAGGNALDSFGKG